MNASMHHSFNIVLNSCISDMAILCSNSSLSVIIFDN